MLFGCFYSLFELNNESETIVTFLNSAMFVNVFANSAVISIVSSSNSGILVFRAILTFDINKLRLVSLTTYEIAPNAFLLASQ